MVIRQVQMVLSGLYQWHETGSTDGSCEEFRRAAQTSQLSDVLFEARVSMPTSNYFEYAPAPETD